MIQLFVADIDGCLASAYQPYDLHALQTMAVYARKAGTVGRAPEAWPPVSLCSGRPYSYVEAMAQLLGLQTPVLFESGAGCFDPVQATTTWHPAFTAKAEAAMAEVRQWIQKDLLPGTGLTLEWGKRVQVGVVAPAFHWIEAAYPKMKRFVADLGCGILVAHTDVSIDVTWPDITKASGLHWLGAQLSVPLDAMAYIGDSPGDLAALEAVGFSFAPQNAVDTVKSTVSVVTRAAVAEGALEAYRWCLSHNHASMEKTKA